MSLNWYNYALSLTKRLKTVRKNETTSLQHFNTYSV